MRNNKLIKIFKLLLLLALILILISSFSLAYKMDPPDEVVHQHITNESKEVWSLIPYEIKEHATNDITLDLNSKMDSF